MKIYMFYLYYKVVPLFFCPFLTDLYDLKQKTVKMFFCQKKLVSRLQKICKKRHFLHHKKIFINIIIIIYEYNI